MITKKQLGIGFIFSGILLGMILFFAGLLGFSQFDGIGPLQRNLIYAAIGLILLGLPLLSLGDRPA